MNFEIVCRKVEHLTTLGVDSDLIMNATKSAGTEFASEYRTSSEGYNNAYYSHVYHALSVLQAEYI